VVDSSAALLPQQVGEEERSEAQDPAASLDMYFPVAFVLAGAVMGRVLPPALKQVVAALLCLVVGLPHGAGGDSAILEHMHGIDRGLRLVSFKALYLAAMAAFNALIYFRPMVGIGLFLLLSAHHFGQSHDSRQKSARLDFLGASLIAALVVFNTDDSATFLQALAPGHVQPILAGIRVFGGLGLAGYGLLAARDASLADGSAPGSDRLLMEVLLLAAVAGLSASNDLAWSFSVYFSLGHAFESWRSQFVKRRQSEGVGFLDIYKESLPDSLSFMVGYGATMWLVLQGVVPVALERSLLLAGSMPHIVITDWLMPMLQPKQTVDSAPGT